MTRKSIHADLGLLADGHVRQLGFLVVRDHPDVRQWYERGDLSPDPHVLTRFDLTLADHAVLGCENARVTEIDLGDLKAGHLRGPRRLGLGLLGGEHGELAGSRSRLGAVLSELRGKLGAERLRLLLGLGGRGPGFEQSLLARDIPAVLLGIGDRGVDGRSGRLDIRLLKLALRVERLDLRGGGRYARFELRDCRAIVIVDDLSQHIAGMHSIEVLYRQGADIAPDLGRDRRQVRLKIGVIRGLPLCVALPASPAGGDHDEDAQGNDEYARAPDQVRSYRPYERSEPSPRWRHDVP